MNIEREGPIRNFRRRITPLVFAATGEMEKEAEKFYKMLAAPLAEKRMTAQTKNSASVFFQPSLQL